MSGSDNKGANEPSMDDILASIRKILNEDEAPGALAAPLPEPPPPPPSPEPLVLTADMLLEEPMEVPPPSLPLPPLMLLQDAPPMPDPDLMAPAAAAATAASMGLLLRAVTQERSSSVTRGGPTIEDVVREEMRPLLKEWLDTHLPGIVDRAVKAEIERVVGRNL